MNSLALYLWVGLGGALGSMLRYGLGGWLEGRLGDALPWGTLAVNVLGSFLIGVLFYCVIEGGRPLIGQHGKALLVVGFCGGFTTFSAFSLQVWGDFILGHWYRAGGYVLLSVVLCLLAVMLGHWLAARLSWVA